MKIGPYFGNGIVAH